MIRPLLFALFATSLSCSSEFAVPSEAIVSCRDSDECITGFVCRAGQCVPSDQNQRPTVTLLPIERQLSSFALPLIVRDPEGDRVSLRVQIRANVALGAENEPEPPFIDATVSGTENIEADDDGDVLSSVVWDAPTDLERLSRGAFADDLQLLVVAFDELGAGPPARSERFSFGNDAPEIVGITLDDDPVTGNSVVRFTVRDAASDPVDLTRFEVSREGDFSEFDAAVTPIVGGAGTDFPGGSVSGLPTSPAGVQQSVTWASDRLAQYDAPNARIRLEVTDSVGA
ncbi:MAG: hypothetical protein AAFY60_13365, partial [Myxococcota bacterium]